MTSRTVLLLSLSAAALLPCAGADDLADMRLPGKNLVNNGGFERGAEGWDYFAGRRHGGVVEGKAHTGGKCLEVTGDFTDYRYLNQTPVPLVPGREYTLSAWIKSDGLALAGGTSQVVNLHNWGWTQGVHITPGQATEDWTFHSVTFTAPPTSEAGGRPSYTVCIFWPIGTRGTVWIDDIQIEEGAAATDYTESYVGWGLDALETLRRVRKQGEAVQVSLARGLNGVAPPPELTRRAQEAGAQADELAGKLQRFVELPAEAARSLPDEAQALAEGLARLSGIAFLGDAYRPLNEIALPDHEPDELAVSLDCLHGDRRAVALNIANLGPDASVARVAAGDLLDLGRQVRLVGTEWLALHHAPQMRGHQKPWMRYTDALPTLDPGGTWTLAPGQVSQVVMVVDTAALLPGEYTGEVEVLSLTEQAPARKVSFAIRVAPVRLAPLAGPLVCDIGAMAEYAADSIQPLGVNAFSVPAQWLAPECAPGTTEITVDFARIAPLVRARLERCPDGRFWLGFGAGAVASAQLQKLRGVSAGSPELAEDLGNWTRAVVRGFGELGVGPERLIFETVDEPGAGQREEAAAIAEAIKRAAPQVSTQSYVTSFEPEDEACRRMYQAHDIIGLAYTCVTEQSVAYLRGIGKRVWVYDCQNCAETFHPVTYYRLMPWLAWRHGLDGWGLFSLLDSERGRGYEPWHGVAEESLVYPAIGGGQVISRRSLAFEAGAQDYRALATLTGLAGAARGAGVRAEALVRELTAQAAQDAGALAKPGRDYFTGLQPGADPAVLERFRDEAARLAGDLAEALGRGTESLAAALVTKAGAPRLSLNLPQPANLTARYLCDRQLPWRTVSADLPQGESSLPLPCPEGATVTRCVFQAADERGIITSGTVPPIPQITVDSTIEPYTPERLNDGLAMPGMKFEPEWGWISGGAGVDHWVAAAVDEPRAIRGVRVWWMSFYGPPKAYRVQAAVDGDWRDVGGFADWRTAEGPVEEISFPPITTDAVRVVQKAGGGNANFGNLMGMSEIELVLE